MTTRHFDALIESFPDRGSHRTAVRTAAVVSALGIVRSGQTAAKEATPTGGASTGNPAFLFVQTASSGSFRPNPEVGTPVVDGTPVSAVGATYLLTLDGHFGGTIYFSDRPEGIVGETPT